MPTGSWVQKTAWGIVVYVFQSLTGEASNVIWQWFSRLFSAPVAVLSDPLVLRLTQIIVGLVLGLLPVLIGGTILKEMLHRMDGTSVTPPESLVRRGLVTGVAVTATSLVAWYMTTLAELARGVLAGVGLDINLLQQFIMSPTDLKITIQLLNLLFIIGAVVVTVQRLVVAAEFTVMIVIGPVMAAGLMREGGNSSWNIWLRELTSLLITPVLQLLVTLLFVRKWAGSGTPPDVGDRLVALALLWVLWNTPRWARQMVYSSGAGSMVGAAANAGRMVIVQQLIKAAAAA